MIIPLKAQGFLPPKEPEQWKTENYVLKYIKKHPPYVITGAGKGVGAKWRSSYNPQENQAKVIRVHPPLQNIEPPHTMSGTRVQWEAIDLDSYLAFLLINASSLGLSFLSLTLQ